MENREKKIATRLGFFLFVGFLFLAALVLQFGQIESLFRKHYRFEVAFADASGIIKDSLVKLGGARIGTITAAPRLNADSSGVILEVQVVEGVRIPQNATFRIGTSGLLGDSFLEIRPPAEPSGKYVQPGDMLEGSLGTGIEDLAAKANILAEKIATTVDEANATIVSIREGVEEVRSGFLSSDNADNVHDILANLKETSEKWDALMDSAQETMDAARKTIADASEFLPSLREDLQPSLDNAAQAMDEAKAAMRDARQLLREIQEGEGTLAALLSDPEVRENISAFIRNLREKGILFYRNKYKKGEY